MAPLTSLQAHQLADYFLEMAGSISDYRIGNYQSLTKLQNEELKASSEVVLQSANQLYTLSATLVSDEVQQALTKIGDITGDMKRTYQKLQLIQDALDIAGSAVAFCKAVVSLNPKSIAAATGGLITCLNAARKEDKENED